MMDMSEPVTAQMERKRATRRYKTGSNVYDAANERIKFIFDNFPRIYLSFSGGKDSGVMLNLVLDELF